MSAKDIASKIESLEKNQRKIKLIKDAIKTSSAETISIGGYCIDNLHIDSKLLSTFIVDLLDRLDETLIQRKQILMIHQITVDKLVNSLLADVDKT